MTKETQREWFPAKREPVGFFQTADVALKSDRSLAGPLRMGTAPGVGPSGAQLGGNSDFEVDRTTPRDFDPFGTTRNRFGEIPSARISKEVRGQGGAVRRKGGDRKSD